MSLAIIATAFTFLCWLIGEQVLGSLWTATAGHLNENGVAISNTLRYEWLAIPVAITIGLWIWAALVVTRRQVTTGAYY